MTCGKDIVNSFLNTGANEPLLLPYIVSSLQGEVGHFIWTLGEITDLRAPFKISRWDFQGHN